MTRHPTPDELRPVCQPPETMSRRNGEHWLALLVLRRVSLQLTAHLVRTPVTANQLTGLMILVGLGAAAVAALPGVASAFVAWLLVLAYFVLDLCDGEVARWRRQTSVTGVYLDRVGHYVVEAALLIAFGVRAAEQTAGGWTTVGALGALAVVLVKAETDLVDTARARSGLSSAADDAAQLRSPALGRLRRAGSVLRVNQSTGAIEASSLLLVAAAVDAVTGGLLATRLLVALLAAVAGVMVVLHLVSILASSRLR